MGSLAQKTKKLQANELKSLFARTIMETNFEVSNSRNNFFAIMVPEFYLKYAIFCVKMSS